MLNCNRLTFEDYFSHALGVLDEPERAQVITHLRSECPKCTAGVREAFEFSYVLAALTERTQERVYPGPTPLLRSRVLKVAERQNRNGWKVTVPRSWLRIAAGILIVAGTSGAVWHIGRLELQKTLAATQAVVAEQASAAKKLESQNQTLQALVVAARNAPPVFPGREAIVSVQDPYVLRDLQRAKQTQMALSQALSEERARAAELDKQVSHSNTLLAAGAREKESADREFRKALDAALFENQGNVHKLSGEITNYQKKVHDLEKEQARYKASLDTQRKWMNQHLRMISLLEAPNLAVMPLHAESGLNASGVALITDNSRIAVFPANLPEPQAGRTYQLWLMRGKSLAPVSVGTFGNESKDFPMIQFGDQQAVSELKAIAITDEPIGGSLSPKGRKILSGGPKR